MVHRPAVSIEKLLRLTSVVAGTQTPVRTGRLRGTCNYKSQSVHNSTDLLDEVDVDQCWIWV